MNGPKPFRIAVTGGPGVGKTSLVQMVAGELRLPVIREEMRSYLEATGVPLHGMPVDQIRKVLLSLWQVRVSQERQHPEFIADNCCLDFSAYALHYDCLEDSRASADPVLLCE